ncbi:ribosome modulation factor [Pseudomonas paeninsulae]|uniref:ribosome modulation factor n=1 Tax=Pseudomonas paeninsulae TaxID=3110772 RepID=UPI002D7870AD|nr:hypothetical protein [Pseudomonas sp. IT1137]
MTRYKKAAPDRDYMAEQQEGAAAKEDAECPYHGSDIGKRCAWLAGYRDNQKGKSYE